MRLSKYCVRSVVIEGAIHPGGGRDELVDRIGVASHGPIRSYVPSSPSSYPGLPTFPESGMPDDETVSHLTDKASHGELGQLSLLASDKGGEHTTPVDTVGYTATDNRMAQHRRHYCKYLAFDVQATANKTFK